MRFLAIIAALTPSALAQVCVPALSDRFAPTDFANQLVRELCHFNDGSGDALYVGGDRTIDGVLYKGICRWNGRQWSPVGGSLLQNSNSGWVDLMVPFPDGGGQSLLVSGWFSSAGGVPVSDCAKWNGSSWTPMDAGYFTWDGVKAAAVVDFGAGPALYAAGVRSNAIGYEHGVARWNGTGWTVIGSLTSYNQPGNYSVYAMTGYNVGQSPRLIVGGNIGRINGIVIDGIAAWNGGAWSPIGVVQGSGVRSMAVHDDGGGPQLYVAGNFASVGGVPASCIARWDGSLWTPVSHPLCSAGSVYDELVSFDPDGPGQAPPSLYAAGKFLAGTLRGSVSKWDGQVWSDLQGGMTLPGSISVPEVLGLAASDVSGSPALYVGGLFTFAGPTQSAGFAAWGGDEWTAISESPNAGVRSAIHAGDYTWIAGWFSAVGGRVSPGVARWNGSSFEALPGLSQGFQGTPATASDIELFDDGSGPAMYVAGNFAMASGATARAIARWNGASWESVESGPVGYWQIYDLAVAHDGAVPRLHAAGRFNTTLQTGRTDIAKLVNGSWVQVGTQLNSVATSIAGYHDGSQSWLYVGSASAAPLRRWDGTSWSGPSVQGTRVDRLYSYLDQGVPTLLAGGSFSAVAGVPAVNVARLTPSGWTQQGALPGVTVQSFAVCNDGNGPALYAGGIFSPAAGQSIARLYRWSNSAWEQLAEFTGSFAALPALAQARVEGRPSVLIGGTFATANSLASANVAALVGCCYANCDGSIQNPLLNVADFACFLNKFAAADPYANCDGSTNPPILNVADFGCFLTKFAAGCP